MLEMYSFYRSLCAVKVLLALLRSTLTVPAAQQGRFLSVRVGEAGAGLGETLIIEVRSAAAPVATML
jgi:hypothetical protein